VSQSASAERSSARAFDRPATSIRQTSASLPVALRLGERQPQHRPQLRAAAFGACVEADVAIPSPSVAVPLTLMIGSLIPAAISAWYRQPVIHDLELAPFSTGIAGGGLALAGRF
jgi:hypothetical protein